MSLDQATRHVRGIIPDAANRAADDFYKTPPQGMRRLLAVERLRGRVWDPACGDGVLGKEMAAAGYDVISSDLVDRGYGLSPVDFLSVPELPDDVESIVTNPPFKLAEEFAAHALTLGTPRVALLMRLLFLEGARRRKFFFF